MKIIAFTGMPFSGKSVAVEVAKDLGFSVVRMGDMVWEEVEGQGFKLTDENVGRIAIQMREKFGKDIWAQRTIEKIRKMKSLKKLVIDGIRNREETETFKKELGKDFVVIAIIASDRIRYKRALSRGREDDSNEVDKIKERDEREKGWGIEKVINSADVALYNEGSAEDFTARIKKLLTKY